MAFPAVRKKIRRGKTISYLFSASIKTNRKTPRDPKFSKSLNFLFQFQTVVYMLVISFFLFPLLQEGVES